MLKKHKSMHREAPQWKPSARGEMGAIEKSSGFSKALKNKFLHSELVGSIWTDDSNDVDAFQF